MPHNVGQTIRLGRDGTLLRALQSGGEVLVVRYGKQGGLAVVMEYRKDLGTKTETKANLIMEQTMPNDEARKVFDDFTRRINSESTPPSAGGSST